ncbi:MAG: WYL domain-containing protein [Candidatus Obscuribacter sp.]|nr:WYL domain-containing protein [Candidatus Obscuribacter sp.]
MTASTALKDCRFVAFDVETTGLSAIACRVVELSGVSFRLSRADSQTFSSLVNPGQPIPFEVSRIHGIDDAMVKDAPSARQVMADFNDFIGSDSILMAHNAAFDVEFVKVEMERVGLVPPDNLVLDSLTLAQVIMDGDFRPANFKLKTLAEFFGFGGDEYHRALADSIYVQKLFCELIKITGAGDLAMLTATGALKPFGQWVKQPDKESLPEHVRAHLSLLESAITSRGAVKLTYQGEFKSTRTVKPQAVIASRGSLYLSAYCTRSRAERTFRLDRIVEAVLHN